MLRVNQIKMPVETALVIKGIRKKHKQEALVKKTASILKIKPEEIEQLTIVRQSLDARHKPQLFYVYTVDIVADREKQLLDRFKHKQNQIMQIKKEPYTFPFINKRGLAKRPIVIGFGPAGMFCSYFLAKAGFAPVILERGADVEERIKQVEKFWQTGDLDINTNVQFGEGGAGTFSDGKLNSMVKDLRGLGRTVLEVFVEAGADEEILYAHKPHIGTDMLAKVVKNIRLKILEMGGEIRFHSQVTDLLIEDNVLKGLVINHSEQLEADFAVLAAGHSARDTIERLWNLGIQILPKAFAVGVRVEHAQDMIDQVQYGLPAKEALLPAADYKLTAGAGDGRGVYSFCMCPGGYVVNASSEPGRLAVNGMSYHSRAGVNANSAIVASVSPQEYGDGNDPLSGIAFQRKLEEAAFKRGKGLIPVQRMADFVAGYGAGEDGRTMTDLAVQVKGSAADLAAQVKGSYCFTSLNGIFPLFLERALIEGMKAFDRKIPGFASDSVLLSAVESRTSSPVRISRDASLESSLPGLFPCGEGAGYAGGIMSAALDGIKVAEAVAGKYQ